MTSKASAAKIAKSAEPVFAYIASLPQPQRGIAEGIDALAARTSPDIQREVKWGMAYYGVDGGWCFSSVAFVGHVKLMFIRGTKIKPEPPMTPIGIGKSARGVELASSDDFNERQLASWMKQAATMPFVGGEEAMTTPWRSVQDVEKANKTSRRKRCAMPLAGGRESKHRKTGLGACHPAVPGEMAQNAAYAGNEVNFSPRLRLQQSCEKMYLPLGAFCNENLRARQPTLSQEGKRENWCNAAHRPRPSVGGAAFSTGLGPPLDIGATGVGNGAGVRRRCRNGIRCQAEWQNLDPKQGSASLITGQFCADSAI